MINREWLPCPELALGLADLRLGLDLPQEVDCVGVGVFLLAAKHPQGTEL